MKLVWQSPQYFRKGGLFLVTEKNRIRILPWSRFDFL